MKANPALTAVLMMALTAPPSTYDRNAHKSRAGSAKGRQSNRTRKNRARAKISRASRRTNRT